jgi:hypothetical protein
VDTTIANAGWEGGLVAHMSVAGWTPNKYDQNVLEDSRLLVFGDLVILPGITLKADV